MQVSHAQDHVTHAFLGAKESRAVGISDDPAFFQILSSTLYQNQKLAVIRETLCNAWDAHIEAGKTDVPIEITLDDDALVIRDRGFGIPDDLMQPIYGVYGASTKKRNKNVTGGFGLGCKAPWSYTEHFEVTSFNGGTKTIYNMSRSSAEVGGRPDITPIASFPTTETGLQVTIQLVNSNDRIHFERLINTVVRNGEILATLNGDSLMMFPFSKSQLGYIIVPKNLLDNNRVNVRYGNVIYPVTEYPAEICKLLNRMGDGYHNSSAAIVVQAPADSLSITPSRETLSMTDQTKETLQGLFDAVIANTMDEVSRLERELTKEHIAALVNTPNDLFDLSEALLKNRLPKSKSIITNTREIALRILENHFRYYHEPKNEEMIQRAKLLEKSGIVDRSLVRGYRYAVHKGKSQDRYKSPELTWWLFSQMVQPMKDALLARNLPTNRLKLSIHTPTVDARFHDLDQPFYMEVQHAFPLLRKFVVLAHTKADIEDRLYDFPQIKETHGTKGVFVYMVPRTYTRLTALREAFTAAGMTLLDLTVAQPWEDPDVVEPIVYEKRTTNKGIPALSDLVDGCNIVVPADPASSTEIKVRLENPKYVIKLPRGKESCTFDDERFGGEATRVAIRLFGEETGVVISATQHKSYIEKGAKDLLEHIQEFVLSELQTNKRIRKYLAQDFRRARYMRSNIQQLLESLEHHPEAAKLFKMPKPLKESDQDIVKLDQGFMKTASKWVYTEYEEKREAIMKALPYPKEHEDFYIKLYDNQLLGALDLYSLSNQIDTKNPETLRSIIQMLKIVLKA